LVVIMRHGEPVGRYHLSEIDASRLLVTGSAPIPTGKPVRVALQLDGDQSPIELVARVVRTTQLGSGRVMLTLELAHVAAAIEDRLQEAALHTLVEDLRPPRPAE
jgi:hypothetical protein